MRMAAGQASERSSPMPSENRNVSNGSNRARGLSSTGRSVKKPFLQNSKQLKRILHGPEEVEKGGAGVAVMSLEKCIG